MNEMKILAVDVGYGNTKASWGADPSEEICFKSLAPSSSADDSLLSGSSIDRLDRVKVQVSGNSYLVGPEAWMAGGSYSLDPDYVQRNEYLALLRGAIHYYFKKTGSVTRELDVLALGLPVSSFSKYRDQLGKVGKFEHPVPIPRAFQAEFGHSVVVTAKKVIVLPQPVGALRHSAGISGVPNGKQLGANSVNLVIDPGYKTFDWLISKGFQPDLTRSGSFPGGMSQILRDVSGVAGMELGVGQIDLVECELALETGVLHASGKKLPFDYQRVADKSASEVVERFANAIDSGQRFDNIIMTGGGSKFYEKALRKRFQDYDITVRDDSVMTNARGFRMIASDLLR